METVVKEKKHYKNFTVKPRVKKVFEKVTNEGKDFKNAMLEVGYSEGTSKTPQNITEGKSWKFLVETFLSDDELTKKHNEQLNSAKMQKLYFDVDDSDETIEEVCKKLNVELLYTKLNKEGTNRTAFVKAPDYFFRDLALDKAYKVKGRYSGENTGGGNKTLIINITGETAQRYNVLPKSE